MKVIAERIEEADERRGTVDYQKTYLYPTGYECKETRQTALESDYVNKIEYRTSQDNGRNYTQWIPAKRDEYSKNLAKTK